MDAGTSFISLSTKLSLSILPVPNIPTSYDFISVWVTPEIQAKLPGPSTRKRKRLQICSGSESKHEHRFCRTPLWSRLNLVENLHFRRFRKSDLSPTNCLSGDSGFHKLKRKNHRRRLGKILPLVIFFNDTNVFPSCSIDYKEPSARVSECSAAGKMSMLTLSWMSTSSSMSSDCLLGAPLMLL
jgi:hypothetical protein